MPDLARTQACRGTVWCPAKKALSVIQACPAAPSAPTLAGVTAAAPRCPPGPQVKAALPALARLIHSQDEEVLTDACWALSYLSDGTNDKIQEVINSGVCRRLVELLL